MRSDERSCARILIFRRLHAAPVFTVLTRLLGAAPPRCDNAIGEMSGGERAAAMSELRRRFGGGGVGGALLSLAANGYFLRLVTKYKQGLANWGPCP